MSIKKLFSTVLPLETFPLKSEQHFFVILSAVYDQFRREIIVKSMFSLTDGR